MNGYSPLNWDNDYINTCNTNVEVYVVSEAKYCYNDIFKTCLLLENVCQVSYAAHDFFPPERRLRDNPNFRTIFCREKMVDTLDIVFMTNPKTFFFIKQKSLRILMKRKNTRINVSTEKARCIR